MDDLTVIGNKDQFKAVEQCILDGIPVLIWGKPGIGKTHSIRVIAKKHKYSLIEINMSDDRGQEALDRILNEVKQLSFVRKIYLFDEIDGAINYVKLKEIILKSRYSIAMTANDYRAIPEHFRKFMESNGRVIKYYPPQKREIFELIKTKFGVENNILVTDDVRNSVLASITGGETYSPETDFYSVITDIFTRGLKEEYLTQIDSKNLYIWLIENLFKFFRFDFYKIYRNIEIISQASLFDKLEVLDCLDKTERVRSPVYPYFFERLKAIKKK